MPHIQEKWTGKWTAGKTRWVCFFVLIMATTLWFSVMESSSIYRAAFGKGVRKKLRPHKKVTPAGGDRPLSSLSILDVLVVEEEEVAKAGKHLQDALAESVTLPQTQTFYYTAQQPNSETNNNTAVIWIVNAKPYPTQYSVLAVVPGQFTRAALQTTEHDAPRFLSLLSSTNTTNAARVTEFALHLPMAGRYVLVVHEIFAEPDTRRKKLSPRIPPFPVEGASSLQIHNTTHNNHRYYNSAPPTASSSSSVSLLPPCQAVSHHAFVPWEGNWMGPDAAAAAAAAAVRIMTASAAAASANHHPMRTGWSFWPDTCVLESFSTQELALMTQAIATANSNKTHPNNITTIANNNNNSKTIAVLGTSRERGIFLSLIDMLLHPHEKAELEPSKVGKCWGRAHVRINDGALQIIFQDFRLNRADPEEQPGTVVCHGDHVGVYSGYLQNATAMVKELFQDPAQRPDVLLLWSGCHNFQLNKVQINNDNNNKPQACMVSTAAVLHAIPRDWEGSIYLTTGFMQADTNEVTQSELDTYLHNMKWFHRYLGDPRVLGILDVYRLTVDMRLYTEFVGKLHGSTHQHRWCNQNDTMRVCSNVTEAIANLLIGQAIAPLGKAQWYEEHSSLLSDPTNATTTITTNNNNRELEICTDCPRNLLPFHIKIKPDLECVQGRFTASRVAGAAWQTPACPDACFQQVPDNTTMTQSGPVAVRVCRPPP